MENSTRKIKMVALDLDGTTLRKDKSLAERTVKAFDAAIANGTEIVIATGRVFDALPESIMGYKGINYIINSNGATIRDVKRNEIIYKNMMAPETVEMLIPLINYPGHRTEIFARGGAYVGQDEYDRLAAKEVKLPHEQYVLNTRIPVPDIFALMEEMKDDIENISVNFRDISEKKELYNKLKKIDDITVTSSFWFNVEVGGASTSKASAIDYLVNKLGIKQSEIMAVGDSENDSRIIEFAGVGVAMGNASDDVKNIADEITLTNEEDGVAVAIEKLVL